MTHKSWTNRDYGFDMGSDHVITYLLWRALWSVPPLNLRESDLRFQDNWSRPQ